MGDVRFGSSRSFGYSPESFQGCPGAGRAFNEELYFLYLKRGAGAGTAVGLGAIPG